MKVKTCPEHPYLPVQPAVDQSSGHVRYREFQPDTRLRPYIHCYWELKTPHPLGEPFSYRVVADGCIDVFFDLSFPFEPYVMGFCTSYTEFSLGISFHYLGVRFQPGMFSQLLRVNASELCNRVENLAEVVPSFSRSLSETIFSKQKLAQVEGLLDHFFLMHLAKTPLDLDRRLYGALDIIYRNQGNIRANLDLDTGICQRQLRRLFAYYIGHTPKAFSKVVRFQRLLRSIPAGQAPTTESRFFDAGYYDQAHFTKEFKTLYGLTPGRAYRK